MKTLLKLFRVGCLVFLAVAVFAMWWAHESISPARTDPVDPVVVEIPPGATGEQVARQLEQAGVIRSALALRLLMKMTDERALKAGHYEVDPNDSPVLILKKLSEGRPMTRRATLPEGLTLPQVAEVLAREHIINPEHFLELVQKRGKSFQSDLPDNLEGYLFPDTYEFEWGASDEDVVRQMLARFHEVVDPLWKERHGKAPLKLDQTVILASMIEREAQVARERPLIAGVYVNRMKKNMLLQCDATIQYALGQPKKALTYQDLELESPYNTYKHPGLPPGPIANPGKASLEAAMTPEPSNYLFYVRNDVKGDGSHVFSRTYQEHQDAIQKYQR